MQSLQTFTTLRPYINPTAVNFHQNLVITTQPYTLPSPPTQTTLHMVKPAITTVDSFSSSSSSSPPASCYDSFSTNNSSGCKVYKGVRKRKWGKWVSEIRLPNSRERIWLGSYETQEKAARAFDAALYCLRGKAASFNFPDTPQHMEMAAVEIPCSHQEIQEVAAKFANKEGFWQKKKKLEVSPSLTTPQTQTRPFLGQTIMRKWTKTPWIGHS
ncbi:hypothetical protein ACSQ67_000424 [Phaseolus vulgaris]